MFQGLLLETFVSVTVAKVHGTLLTLDNLDFHSFSTAVVVLQFLSNHMNWTFFLLLYIYCSLVSLQEQRVKDLLKFGGPEDDLLQGRTITIVHGINMVDLVFVNFVSSSVSVANEWATALMCLTGNALAVNAAPTSFLEKQ